MKIVILNPEKKTNYRISKDTSGGYGTGNDFGDTLVPKILKKTLKYVHDWPPLFAVYSLSVLKKNGHEVIYSKIIPKNVKDIDLFIMVSSIVCCETEIETLHKIKSYNKPSLVIGPFATNNPEKYTNTGAAVLLGEPEFYFLKNINLLKDLGKKIINFNHNFTLDDLPYPDWTAVLKNKRTSLLFGTSPSLPILATRGCPYSCFKYCVYPLQQGRLPRHRNPRKIVDEMEYWNKKYKIKMFIFRDPVFSINKKHTIEFCNELISRKLNLNFIIETHLRILDSELIKLLKKAGMKAVKVGVESSDAIVLKNADRFTIKKDEQYLKIRELEKNNILVSAMYIIAFPADDEKTINDTIDFSIKLNTAFAQFSVYTPYPGTPIYKEFNDKITAQHFQEFDQYHLIYKHNLFSKQKVRSLLSKSYTKYYFRISWIFKFVKSYIYAQ